MSPIEAEAPAEDVRALSAHLMASNARLSGALVTARGVAMRAVRLQQFTAALSRATTESEVADVLLDRGLAIVEGDRGVLARIEGRCVHVVRGYPADEAAPHPRSIDDPSPLTLAVKRGEPVWLRGHDRRPQRAATVAVPLRHAGDIVGVLAVSFAKPTARGVADRALTLLLAQAVADALVRARSYDIERTARREAETRAKARAELLGIVAHDLRNPLNVIGASGAMLASDDGVAPHERRKMHDVMSRSVRHMNRLIADLLDATRLQTGRLRLELSTIDARSVIRSVGEMCRPEAEAQGVSLCTRCPAHANNVRGDEGRLWQALGNLVGNAIKFTPRGGRVSMSLATAGREAVFSVADTGPGLTPDQQAHLFDTFWQARPDDRRGIGLGLTITKGIVDAHDGRIWVASAPGAGSTFSFALPMESDE
jgi:signal transduction histidine kinase